MPVLGLLSGLALNYATVVPDTGTPIPKTITFSPTSPGTVTATSTNFAYQWRTNITTTGITRLSWVIVSSNGANRSAVTTVDTTGSVQISPVFLNTGEFVRAFEENNLVVAKDSSSITIAPYTPANKTLSFTPLNPGSITAGTLNVTVTTTGIASITWAVVNSDANYTWSQSASVATNGSVVISPVFTATGQFLKVLDTSDFSVSLDGGQVTIVGEPVTPPVVGSNNLDLVGPGGGTPGEFSLIVQGQSNAIFFIYDNNYETANNFNDVMQFLTGYTYDNLKIRSERSDFAADASLWSGTPTYNFASGSDGWLDATGKDQSNPSTWVNTEKMNSFLRYSKAMADRFPSRPCGMIRMHDETDSQYFGNAERTVYQAANREFIKRFRNYIGRTPAQSPVFQAVVPYGYSQGATAYAMRDAWQAQSQDATQHFYHAYSNAVDAVDRGDYAHWTIESANRVAIRMGIRLSRWFYENGWTTRDLSWLPTFGPNLVSLVRVSGNTNAIDVNVAHDKGTDLIVPVTVNLSNFAFSRNGTAISVTSVTRQSATRLRLSLGSSLASGGTLALDYGVDLNYNDPSKVISDNWSSITKPVQYQNFALLNGVNMILNKTRAPIGEVV